MVNIVFIIKNTISFGSRVWESLKIFLRVSIIMCMDIVLEEGIRSLI